MGKPFTESKEARCSKAGRSSGVGTTGGGTCDCALGGGSCPLSSELALGLTMSL